MENVLKDSVVSRCGLNLIGLTDIVDTVGPFISFTNRQRWPKA